MKIMLSLSKPELEYIEYTGTNGCYASMIPANQSKNQILQLCDELGVTTDADKLHCTVMYSKAAPDKTLVDRFDLLPRLVVYGTSIDHWVGHDDKTYISLQLVSEGLIQEHAKLWAIGCEPTYCPYKPHITLTSDLEVTEDVKARIDQINKGLALNPLEMILINETISDLKG